MWLCTCVECFCGSGFGLFVLYVWVRLYGYAFAGFVDLGLRGYFWFLLVVCACLLI